MRSEHKRMLEMGTSKENTIREIVKLRDYATTQVSTTVVAKDRFTYVWGIRMKQLKLLAEAIPTTPQKHSIGLELLNENIFEVIQFGILTIDWNVLDPGKISEVLCALPFNKLNNEACESIVSTAHPDKLKMLYQSLRLIAHSGEGAENRFLRFSFHYFENLAENHGYSVYNELIEYIQAHFQGNTGNNQKIMLQLLRSFSDKHKTKKLETVIQYVRAHASNPKHFDKYPDILL